MLLTIVTFLALLLVLVLAHEAGHFFAAKRAGVAVEEFGFGFPPRAFSWKRGGTVYSLNWVPLGGFVKLKGESGRDGGADSFASQRLAVRLLIIAAGVAMNFVLAAAFFSVGYGIGVPQELDGPLPYGASVRDHTLEIVAVLPDTPAAGAGFAAGDAILAVDGEPVTGTQEFRDRIAAKLGAATTIRVRRAEASLDLAVVPAMLARTGQPGIGVGLFESGTVSYPWYLAPVAGVRATAIYSVEIVKAFGDLLASIVRTGKPSVDVSGPVGIAVLTGQVARLGFVYLLQFAALLSLNLGVINILPIPALDGGRVLFLALEKIRGRAVSARVESIVHQVGFAALLLLVALVTFNDVLRFFR